MVNRSTEFTDGFMAGYYGREVKDNASQTWLKAYGRGYELAQVEDKLTEQRGIST